MKTLLEEISLEPAVERKRFKGPKQKVEKPQKKPKRMPERFQPFPLLTKKKSAVKGRPFPRKPKIRPDQRQFFKAQGRPLQKQLNRPFNRRRKPFHSPYGRHYYTRPPRRAADTSISMRIVKELKYSVNDVLVPALGSYFLDMEEDLKNFINQEKELVKQMASVQSEKINQEVKAFGQFMEGILKVSENFATMLQTRAKQHYMGESQQQYYPWGRIGGK